MLYSSDNATQPPTAESGPARASGTAWTTLLAIGRRPTWQRLGLAFVIVLAAVGLRIVFLGAESRTAAYLTFYPAVMLTAIFGGGAAGLLATLLSSLLAYTWIQRAPLNATEWLALIVFVLSSALVSGLCELLHRAGRRIQIENEERIRTEAALRENQARYQATVENMDEAVLLTQPDGSILAANPAACRLFGRTEEEICRAGRAGLVDTSDPRLAPLLAQRAATGRARGTVTLRHHDGSRFEAECASSLFVDASGHTCTSMVIRDLTTQQLVATKLERAAQEWQATFDATRNAIWVLDRDCHIIRANRTSELLFGRPCSGMIGCACWEIAHNNGGPLPDCPLVRSTRSLQRETLELPRGEQWYEVVVDPILDEAGHFAGAVHSMSDITARKHAEFALREAWAEAQRFRDALDHVSSFIYMKDPKSRYVFANRPTLELFGCTAEELVGSDDTRFFPPESVERLREVDARVFRGERTTEEIVVPEPTGGQRIYWEIKTPIYAEPGSGTVWGLLGISTDITARKQSEARVEEHNALLHALINSSDDLEVFSLDREYRYTAFNENHRLEMRESWNADIEIGAGLLPSITDPARRERLRQSVARALAGESHTENQHQAETNTHHEFVWNPIRQKDGVVSGVAAFIRNITSSKEAEEALRQSEVLFRSIFEGSNDAILLLMDNRFFDCNPWTLEMFGYRKEQLVGRTLVSLSPPHQPDGQNSATAAEQHIASAFHIGYCRFDWVHRRHNGSTFYSEVLLAAFDFGGRKLLQATVRDITARRAAEDATRSNEATLRGIFSAVPVGIAFVQNRVLLTVNARICEITGYAEEELVGRTSRMLYVDDAEFESVGRTLEQGLRPNGPASIETVFQHKNGTKIHVLLNAAPVDSGEHGANTIITILDITERRRADAEYRDMQTQLQLGQKLESVGRLAAGVAHEINTPTQFVADNTHFLVSAFAQLELVLSAHRPLLEVAARHPDCAAALAAAQATEEENELSYLLGEIPRTLEQSLEGLSRITKIVGSLKEFSHPGGREMSGANLNRAIETALAVSRHEWKYVAEVVTELDPQLPPVPCVLDEFNQAILNLVVNAAHAIGEANPKLGRVLGHITVRTRQEPGWAIVEVVDDGTGIPPEVQARLFEPFFTTKGIGKGTGQGLAMVRNIIMKTHRGRLDFTTVVGQGTTFRLALPLDPTIGDAEPPAPNSQGDEGTSVIPIPLGGAGFTPAIPPPSAP